MIKIDDKQYAKMRQKKLAKALVEKAESGSQKASIDPETGDVLFMDAEGNAQRFAFDQQGFIGKITSPLGRSWGLKNGPKGRFDGIRTPSGLALNIQYDFEDFPTSISENDEKRLGLNFNKAGKITQLSHADQTTTKYQYWGDDLLTETINRLGHQESYTYDLLGNLTAFADANQKTTRFEYSQWNKPDCAYYPDGQKETYGYDEKGRVKTIQFRAGASAELAYEGDETQASTIQYSDNELLTFVHDDTGRTIEAKNAESIANYTYDDNGKLLEEIINERSIQYHYNKTGALTGLSYPNSNKNTESTIEIAYDADARVSQVKDWAGNIIDWDYKAQEAGYHIRYPNDLAEEITQNRYGKITSQMLKNAQQEQVHATEYKYDIEARLTASIDSRLGKRQYQYDAESHLLSVEADHAKFTESFTYDPAGNRTQVNGKQAQFDPANRLLNQGNIVCTTNLQGELAVLQNPQSKQSTQWQFNWSTRGLLMGAESYEGTRIQFAYDAFGRRIKKQVTQPECAEKEIRYFWAGEHLISEETWQEATCIRQQDYLYQPGSYTPLATRINEDIYYYHCDHLGTPKRLTDINGKVVWEAEHNAYGEAYIITAEIENPLRLPGQYSDVETGLHYNRFRYYSPELGRYISGDPLGFLAGNNFYSYVNGDPVNGIDPLGLWWKAALSVAAGVAATVAAAAIIVVTAPVSVPLMIAAGAGAAVLGVSVGLGVNKALNLKEFSLECAASAFFNGVKDGFIMGAAAAVAVVVGIAAAPAVAGIALASLAVVGGGYAIASMLDEHLGWSSGVAYADMSVEDQNKSLFSMVGEGVGGALGGALGAKVVKPVANKILKIKKSKAAKIDEVNKSTDKTGKTDSDQLACRKFLYFLHITPHYLSRILAPGLIYSY